MKTYSLNKLAFTICLALIIAAVLPNKSFGQNEWSKWGRAEISYTIKSENGNSEAGISNPGFITSVLSVLRSGYAFLISDVDGDNCPFYPSCSNFFVQSVNEEGLIKGAFMFADRFTRDMNFLKSPAQYPMHVSGRFYDPPRNRALEEDKIIYYPSETTVKK